MCALADDEARLARLRKITKNPIALAILQAEIDNALARAKHLAKQDSEERTITPRKITVETPMSDIGLTRRTFGILHRMSDIETAGQLDRMTDAQLLDIVNLGPTAVAEIRRCLTAMET